MKKRIFACALIFLAFATSACVHTAHGPTDNTADAAYVQSVQAVVGGGESVTFMDKAYMLANTARPGPAQTWGVFGTIVVTDKALYFLFWNQNTNAFDVLRKLPIADMIRIEHISSAWGPGDYISIEDTSNRFDLYACYTIPVTADVVEQNRKLLDSLNAAKNAK